MFSFNWIVWSYFYTFSGLLKLLYTYQNYIPNHDWCFQYCTPGRLEKNQSILSGSTLLTLQKQKTTTFLDHSLKRVFRFSVTNNTNQQTESGNSFLISKSHAC